MCTGSRLAKSRALADWLDLHIDGVRWPSDDRSVLAAGCLDTALEHHRAVVFLIENRLYGSAFALVRAVFESYIRGIWLNDCATNAELAAFQADKVDRPIADLIAAIETTEGFGAGTLSRVKSQWWSAMNSFTHCGISPVARRVADSEIRPNFDGAEVIEALQFVDGIALLVAGYIASATGSAVLAADVLDKLRNGDTHP